MHAQALHSSPMSAPAAAGSGRITEIIQHSAEVPLAPLLLPMLAQLSHSERWLALIAPPSGFDRDSLQSAGAQLDRVWILRPDAAHSAEELAARALTAGTCHTVISWHPQFNDDTLQRLQHAASGQDVQGIVVRGH